MLVVAARLDTCAVRDQPVRAATTEDDPGRADGWRSSLTVVMLQWLQAQAQVGAVVRGFARPVFRMVGKSGWDGSGGVMRPLPLVGYARTRGCWLRLRWHGLRQLSRG